MADLHRRRRAQQHVRHRRRLIIAGAGLVAAVVVLTAVLVAVHTKPGAAAAAQSSEGRKTNATSSISELGEGSGSDDYWALSRPAADQQPCIGPPLACQVVNPLPLPQVHEHQQPSQCSCQPRHAAISSLQTQKSLFLAHSSLLDCTLSTSLPPLSLCRLTSGACPGEQLAVVAWSPLTAAAAHRLGETCWQRAGTPLMRQLRQHCARA